MKIINSIVIFLVFVSLTAPSYAEFLDMPANHEAYPSVQKLLDAGIVSISPSKKFNGKTVVNMYQLAFILDRILEKTGKTNEIEARPLEDFYSDVPSDHYAYKAIGDLLKLRLFTIPASKRFEGEAQLDRYTFYSYFAVFLERVEDKKLPEALPGSGYPDVPVNNPAYIYIQKLVGAGLLDGKGNFEGNALVSRYEMAIFSARVLDYYSPEPVKGEKKEVAVDYVDIPEDNYARQAVSELIESGILTPEKGEGFYGGNLINRYLLIDFISKIIERIVAGEGMALPEAAFALSYKDVPVNLFAYPSIQKLIALGVIPSGDRRELLYGDRRISRYQMLFFTFSAVKYVLSDFVAFKQAPSSMGYADVPQDHFVYETIQKLIELGVLEGGKDRQFEGEKFVDRYELCDYTVKFIKALFLKIEEVKEAVQKRPVEYGFKTFLDTQLTAAQTTNGKAPGEDAYDLSAYQSVSISVDRSLNEVLSGFVSLTSKYNLGASSSTYLDQAYVMANASPLALQLGRTSFYKGFTPFGNSMYMDTSSSDMIVGNFSHALFDLQAAAGKLWYAGDVKLDSNFGTLNLSPKFPPFLSWLELTVGESLITNLPDPAFTSTLPTRVTQAYGGIKINLFSLLEFSIENARLDFSNSDVLPLIGATDEVDTAASQYSLTYFSEDYGYSLSLGYQKIGDDYFLSTLANPAVFLATERNTESLLFKTRFYPSPSQTVGVDFAYVLRDNYNIKTGARGNYSLRFFEPAYLNLALTRIVDNTSARQDELNISSSFSISF